MLQKVASSEPQLPEAASSAALASSEAAALPIPHLRRKVASATCLQQFKTTRATCVLQCNVARSEAAATTLAPLATTTCARQRCQF